MPYEKTEQKLAIDQPSQLLFGVAPKPLTTPSGLILGGGKVVPELNFTLPSMLVEAGTIGSIIQQYREIIADAAKRAVELEAPGWVIEFETLPPMTQNPSWSVEITKVLVEGVREAKEKHGLPGVVRITPNDIREFERPPRMRSGPLLDAMWESFERCAEAGAELLSIESVGGKEVHDDALTMGDLQASIFGLCILGARDMRFLWTRIVEIAGRHKVIPAGDTACGFANTAMTMAEQRLIPRSFAAVVRAVSAVRSLEAYRCGAVGPGKDCGYENLILKAITGFPMAMEGKTAACAHKSPLGNIAASACDTWSNESVQNVKLLGGMAPTCYLEQLVYDTRLMNQALSEGAASARKLRDWLVKSDAAFDPQAYVLTPKNVIRIARAIAGGADAYHAGTAAAKTAVKIIQEGVQKGELKLDEREKAWVERMKGELDELPASEAEFIQKMMASVDTTRFKPEEYEL